MSGEKNSTPQEPLETIFIALKALQGMQQVDAMRPIVLADIVEYIRGNEYQQQRVAVALATDLRVRKQFTMLLNQQRIAIAPQEALAQHAAELEMRLGEGFTLLFRRSRADQQQVYVILELDPALEPVDGAAYSILAMSESDVVRVRFPALNNNRAQAILREGDKQLELLRDPNIELNLIFLN
jgi:hypothetical protein